MNPEELLKIIQGKDKESLTLELKTRNTLRYKQEDITPVLVSFANRYGGQLLIGVKDSGDLDGKYNSPKEVDDDKGRIDNICTQKCSPPLSYTADLVETPKGDIIVVNVNRRQGPPHAVIKKRGGEIKERLYYARTSHGKRLVTDSQLNWMFKNPGDYIERKRFTTNIVYNRENYSNQII